MRWGNGGEAKKSKIRDFQLFWGVGREDVAQGLLCLTFRNQVLIKLDEYKNLEISAVAYSGMPSSYMVKIDPSV